MPGFEQFLTGLLSSALKELTIYEDYDEEFRQHCQSWLAGGPVHTNHSSLGLALALASKCLEHLSASFIIDAEHFFRLVRIEQFPLSLGEVDIAQTWTWSKLESLALTSRLLAPNQRTDDINHLLESAAYTVRSMPKLRVMEIWGGEGKEGTIFRSEIQEAMGVLCGA